MGSNAVELPEARRGPARGRRGGPLVLAAFVFGCELVGGLGALATTPNIASWYETLARPEWRPPNWLFGPVWTALYALMGASAFLVWQRRARPALALFGVQLALNAAWSWIFFYAHEPGWAFAEILVLWAAILAWIVAAWRASPLAGALQIPYLAWVTFASALNFAVWRMNLGRG